MHPEYEKLSQFVDLNSFYLNGPQNIVKMKKSQYHRVCPVNYFRPPEIEFPNFQRT
jgi:hypothetical protein